MELLSVDSQTENHYQYELKVANRKLRILNFDINAMIFSDDMFFLTATSKSYCYSQLVQIYTPSSVLDLKDQRHIGSGLLGGPST